MSSSRKLEQLWDDHAQALFALALSITRSEADTRDVLQEVFSKVAQRSVMLAEVREERAFLLRMANNAALDVLRRRGSRERAFEKMREEPELFAFITDPDEAAFRKALADALAELPPDQRTVLHLKLWEGMTFEKIAQSLGLSINTAASRYRYGLEKLRDALRPLYEEIK